MVMKPYGMWNWITNKCSIPPSFPWPLSLFFFLCRPLLFSISHSSAFPPLCRCPPNKATIRNWNSMLSRSEHLIYKIKLKASHAQMVFCDNEERRRRRRDAGVAFLFQLHTIIFLSCDFLVPGGDTFVLSPVMMCQTPHLIGQANVF